MLRAYFQNLLAKQRTRGSLKRTQRVRRQRVLEALEPRELLAIVRNVPQNGQLSIFPISQIMPPGYIRMEIQFPTVPGTSYGEMAKLESTTVIPWGSGPPNEFRPDNVRFTGHRIFAGQGFQYTNNGSGVGSSELIPVKFQSFSGSINEVIQINIVSAAALPEITQAPPAQYELPVGIAGSLSVTAIGPGPLTYNWYRGFAPDRSRPVGTNSPTLSIAASNVLALPENYWVEVSNAAGSARSATTTVRYIRVPLANAGGPYNVPEGDIARLEGAAGTWVNSFNWDFDGDGVFGELQTVFGGERGRAPTFDANTLDGPSSRQARLKVTGEGDLTDFSNATLNIINVAPTATFRQMDALAQTVGFAQQFDPSAADTIAGFKYSYSFFDNGTFDIVGSTSAIVPIPANYVPGTPIRGRIEDKDGGFTDYTTKPINVNMVVNTTTDESNGTLQGAGTSLREALAFAIDLGGPQVIAFDQNIFGTTREIVLSLGQLSIIGLNQITIEAPPKGIKLTGNGSSRLLQISPGAGLILARTTFSGGQALEGGAIRNFGSLTLSDSLLMNNSAAPVLDPSLALGGAIANFGTLNLSNTTLANNSAGRGGGLYSNFGATSNLTHVTIAHNAAGAGAGLMSAGTNVTLINSIVAGNNSTSGPDLAGQAIHSNSHHNIVNLSANAAGLAPLGNYGGELMTVALLPGSPAIDAAAVIGTLTADQRRVSRPQGSLPDIGAYESRGFSVSVLSGNAQSTSTDSVYAAPLVVSVQSNDTGLTNLNGGLISFSAPQSNTAPSATFSSASGGPFATTLNAVINSENRAQAYVQTNGRAGDLRATATAIGSSQVGFDLHIFERPSLTVSIAEDLSSPLDGLISIREAFTYALTLGGPQTITFASQLAGQTIVVDDGTIQLLGNSNLTFDGGTTGVRLDSTENSGNPLFYVDQPASLTLKNLKLSGRSLQNAGILLSNGQLQLVNTQHLQSNGTAVVSNGVTTISDATFAQNSSSNVGGDIYNNGQLTISDSSFTDSISSGSGGSINNRGALDVTRSTFVGSSSNDQGGAILNQGQLVVRDSSFANPKARDGAGIYNQGTATIFSSTITGAQGLGNNSRGGAVYNAAAPASLELTNSTLANNGTTQVVSQGAALFLNGPATITNSTIVGNRSGADGAIVNTTNLLLVNSIVVGNTDATNTEINISNQNVIGGSHHNLLGPGGTGGIVSGVNGNLVLANAADALMGTLGSYGGNTSTVKLLTGSPAIATGSPLANVTRDQRGVLRPLDAPDIGAYQTGRVTLQPTAVNATTGQPLSGTLALGNSVRNTLTLTGSDTTYSVTGNVTFYLYDTATPIFGISVPLRMETVAIASGAASSSPIAGLISGFYSFIVTYNGDANYPNAISSAQPFMVTLATPPSIGALAVSARTTSSATLDLLINANGSDTRVVMQISPTAVFTPTQTNTINHSNFSFPTSLAVNAEGTLFVADAGNGRVHTFAMDGASQSLVGFTSPYGTAVDALGNVYVADAAENRVKKISRNGTITNVGTGFSGPRGVAVDSLGQVYVADTENNALKKILGDGSTAIFVSGLNRPSSLAFDAQGNLLLTESVSQTVKKVSPTGTVTTLATGFNNPSGIAVDQSGNVYVADAGADLVKVIATNGQVTTLGTGWDRPTGVTVDKAGNIYVVDSGHARVTKFAVPSLDALPSPLSGTTPQVASVSATGLTKATPYFARAIVYSPSGTFITPAMSFVTLDQPAVTIAPVQTHVLLPGTISARATLVGGTSPGGTVTFRVFDNTNATGNALFTSTQPLSGGIATSAAYTPLAAGMLYWFATYNGDALNNTAVSAASVPVFAQFNTAPTDIAISQSTINENSPVGSTIGTLTTTDGNSLDSFTYTFVSGTGDTDNNSFAIVGSQLRSAAGLNFESKSNYSVRIKSTDQGGLTFEKILAISVIDLPELAGPAVIGDGTIQRSLVKQMVVTFEGAVDIAAGAFVVDKLGSSGGVVVTSAAAVLNGSGQTIVTLTFSGSLTRGTQGALTDGYYRLTIDATKITRAGRALDANSDGVSGDNYIIGAAEADNFFALFGDTNGDGLVGIAEFGQFRTSFGKPNPDPSYNALFDYDGDGLVDIADFGQFRSRFGKPKLTMS